MRSARPRKFTRGMVTGGTLFEELGFYYVGPIDGHNLDHLLPVLENVRDTLRRPGADPCRDRKGPKAMPRRKTAPTSITACPSSMSSPARRRRARPGPPAYQDVFGETLAKLAETDPRICAITAAMPSGTGVDKFAKAHPSRSFDVGIAEQHGVTFAAGLAAEGMRPFAAIYSTFLQARI